MDGYDKLSKISYFESLILYQEELNKILDNINNEIKEIPSFPDDINKWTNSVSTNSDDFKLSHFKKMFKINRKYNETVDKREINSFKLKEIILDNLINKINKIIND